MERVLLVMTLFILLGCSCNSNKEKLMLQVSKSETTEYIDEEKFLNDAHDAIMMNIHLGRMANRNASSELVRQLASIIVVDCSLSHAELKRIALERKIKLREELCKGKQEQYDAFAKVKGKAFDTAFMKYIIKEHVNNLSVFEDEVVKGSDREIKLWAEGQAGITKHHLEITQQLAMENIEAK